MSCRALPCAILTKCGCLPSRMPGSYESSMGGAGAFWCNSQPLTWSSGCTRRFIVMGFLLRTGRRRNAEIVRASLLKRSSPRFSIARNLWTGRTGKAVFLPMVGPTLNLFQQFICFDQIAPGKSGVGTIHYAPNSDRDYDWNNPRPSRAIATTGTTSRNFRMTSAS